MHAPTLITIVGPTAVGKTATGIAIARALGTEIISADSRQFYRELNIGVATPTDAEQAAARHHFVGHLSIDDYYNVSLFETDALRRMNDLFQQHPSVIMVGGSGLYVNAVCNGIDELPEVDMQLREQLKNTLHTNGIQALRLQLKMLDPDFYAKIDLANPNRVLRALEVCLQSGKPYSQLRQERKKERSFNIIKIGLQRPREELSERIHQRTEQMMREGLLEEVQTLLPKRQLNALNTVGYKEIFAHIEGRCTLPEAIEKIKTNTRRYAKRQMTWFRRDTKTQWFHPDDLSNILAYIHRFQV